jgi:hypothetical protein
MDALLDKNAEGTLTDAERVRLELLVAEAEQVMVANSQRLAGYARDNPVNPPTGSIPVTVWVKPEPAGP